MSPPLDQNIQNQDRIWAHYQNSAPELFSGSHARLAFLAGRVKAKSKVLNIGVGTGIFEELALARGLEVFTLDPSEQSIVALAARLDLQGRAKVGYSQAIPFADNSFDAVVISEVIEHLNDEIIEQTLLEIKRVLVPGGRIIGTVPARENLRENGVMCPDCGKHFHRWGHMQSFDINRMRSLLAPNFVIEILRERLFVTWRCLNWKGVTQSAVKLVLHRLGVHGADENIVFIARK